MRCKNCGWENDSNAIKCERCNASLRGSMGERGRSSFFDSGAPFQRNNESEDQNLRKTVREGEVFQDRDGSLTKCPDCGYLYDPAMGSCPNCGRNADTGRQEQPNGGERRQAPEQNGGRKIQCAACGNMVDANVKFCPYCGKPLRMGTVNPWSRPQQGSVCSLTPVAWENEEKQYEPISYSGDTIVLNRSNTDPNNNSITSQRQAVLTYEQGTWYIEDCSQMQTTFVHAGKKMRLENGAVVILGNRRFVFKG